MNNRTEHNPFLCKEKRIFRPYLLLFIVSAGLIYGIVSFFFGDGGDYRRIQLKLFIDGEAQNHIFTKKGDLSGRNLNDIILRGSCFPEINLENADLSGSDLQNALFKNCNMKNINLENADLQGAILLDCTLDRANLKYTNLTDVDLKGSSLKSVLLSNATLQNCNLDGVDLQDAVGLSTTELSKTTNWHLASFDANTAKTIQKDFSSDGTDTPGYLTWNNWLLKQQEKPLSQKE